MNTNKKVKPAAANVKRYTIEYEFTFIALVEIKIGDESKKAITDMVEFLGGWRDRLAKCKGDYVECFLRQLGLYILKHSTTPDRLSEEGWYPLDGTHGIKLVDFDSWEIDTDDISITAGVCS